MDATMPTAEELKDLSVTNLGERTIPSPLETAPENCVDDSHRVVLYANQQQAAAAFPDGASQPGFELAGPRAKLFFDPKKISCGIVTCGGLCPGLNDVIRTITLSLRWQYGVKKVWGFRYGYQGLTGKRRGEPLDLTTDLVDGLQHKGGTLLGSSRGNQDIGEMVDTLVKYDVSILFVIGGDGTFGGGHAIAKEITKRKLSISVIGVPKTIDNDIFCSEVTFGYSTAIEEGRKAIQSAHEEAISAFNGIGMVKLMGRDSGFIAASAALANSDANFCLVPEVPFELDGPDGFLARLEKRMAQKHHAVIVLAEGAGQELIKGRDEKDASGNIKNKDIGLFLRQAIEADFKKKNIPHTVRYIDPSYMIRSCPANARDSIFCLLLGQNAVHAGMAGKTDMFVGYWNHHYTQVPLSAAVGKRKKIDPNGMLWQTLLLMTD